MTEVGEVVTRCVTWPELRWESWARAPDTVRLRSRYPAVRPAGLCSRPLQKEGSQPREGELMRPAR